MLPLKPQASSSSNFHCIGLHYLFGTPAPNSNFFAEDTDGIVNIVENLQEKGVKLESVDNEGNTIFHEAASDKRSQYTRNEQLFRGFKVLQLLEVIPSDGNEGVGFATQTNYAGQSALHVAAAMKPDDNRVLDEQDSTWFDFLLDPQIGLEVSQKCKSGNTPLHLAAPISEARVWKLVSAGADICAQSGQCRIPLHEAAKAGKINSLALLCENLNRSQLPVDVQDDNGETPLHEAARSGILQAVKILLDAGANPKINNNAGQTPAQIVKDLVPLDLDVARLGKITEFVMDCSKDDTETLWQFDKTKHPFNIPTLDVVVQELESPDYAAVLDLLTSRETTPAQSDTAIPAKGVVLAHRLQQDGGSVAKVTDDKQRVREPESNASMTRELISAILFRQYSTVIDLIARGADVSSPIFEGYETIAHILVRSGALSLLKIILPSVSDVNSFQPPLLHIAVERRESNLDVMQYLIDLGADPNIQHEDKRRARRVRGPIYSGRHGVMHRLSLGHYWWYAQGLAMLAQHGGDLNQADSKGLACFELSSTTDRHYNKQGPYASLCNEVINRIQPHIEPEADEDDLVELIMEGDVDGVRDLLATGANPNRIYEHESQFLIPLQACAMAWDSNFEQDQFGGEAIPEIMDLLLSHGANPYEPIPVGDGAMKAFHFVCSYNAPVQPFIDAGVDLEVRTGYGATPLIEICGWYGYVPQGGRDVFATTLIGSGADLNAVDNMGQTALHKAAQCESHLTNPEVMEALLRAGASASTKDATGHDPFYYFLRNDGDDMEHYKNGMLEDMFKAGVDVCDADADTKETNLHVFMKLMAEEFGSEYWHLSSYSRFVNIYKSMIEQGADGHARDKDGNIPIFHFVKTIGHRKLPKDLDMDWLKEFLTEQDLQAVNDAKDTLLHVLASEPVAYYGRVKLDENATFFRLLMELGVDPKQENAAGMSAIDLAAAHENAHILKIFEDDQE
jgi:ankyrin repeat protein